MPNRDECCETVTPKSRGNQVDHLQAENEKLRAVITEQQQELLSLYRRLHQMDRPSF